jgi:hypothetical protein
LLVAPHDGAGHLRELLFVKVPSPLIRPDPESEQLDRPVLHPQNVAPLGLAIPCRDHPLGNIRAFALFESEYDLLPDLAQRSTTRDRESASDFLESSVDRIPVADIPLVCRGD